MHEEEGETEETGTVAVATDVIPIHQGSLDANWIATDSFIVREGYASLGQTRQSG